MQRVSIKSSLELARQSTSVFNRQTSPKRSRENSWPPLEHTFLAVPELRAVDEDDVSRIHSEVVVTPYNQRLPAWRKANEQDPLLEKWSNRFEFITASLGFTLGYITVFRTPIIAIECGGIHFLIALILLSAFLGIPLLFFEVAIGQFSGLGPVRVFGLIPLMKGLGYTILLEVVYAAILYNAYFTHHAYTLFDSFRSTEPWQVPGSNTSLHLEQIHDYYVYKVLKINNNINGIGGLRWPLVGCLAFVWFLMFIVICRSIKTQGKILRYLVITTLLLCAILFIVVLSQPGAISGVTYFMTPGNQQLTFKTWSEALKIILFSFGLGYGINTMNGSQVKFQSPAHMDCLIVSIVTLCISLMSCLVLFAGVQVVANHLNIDMPLLHSYIIQGNYSLSETIVIYPLMIDHLPNQTVWYVIYELAAFMLSVTSMFPVASMISRSIYAFNPILRLYPNLTSLAIVTPLFLLGLPFVTENGSRLLDQISHYRWVQMINLTLELFSFVFCYGLQQLMADIDFMLQYKPNNSYRISWILTPFIMIGFLIFDASQFEASTLLWTLIPWGISFLIVLLPIPLFALIAIMRYHGRRDLKGAFHRQSEESVLERELQESDWEYFTKGNPSHRGRQVDESSKNKVPLNLSTMKVLSSTSTERRRMSASDTTARRASMTSPEGRRMSTIDITARRASMTGPEGRRMSASGTTARRASMTSPEGRRMSASDTTARRASMTSPEDRRMSTIDITARKASMTSPDGRRMSASDTTARRASMTSAAGRKASTSISMGRRLSAIESQGSYISIDSIMDEPTEDHPYAPEPELPHATNPARMSRRAKNNVFYEPVFDEFDS